MFSKRIWSHCFLLASFVIFSVGLAGADSEVREFRGGSLDFYFSGSSSILFGPGAHSAGMGGTYYTPGNGSNALFWNPAGLGFIETSETRFDVSPPLIINPSDFVDMQQEINDAVDGVIKDMSPDNRKDTIIEEMRRDGRLSYPEFSARGGLPGGFNSGSVALVLRDMALGVGVYQPLTLELKAVATGFRIVMENTEVSGGDTTITKFLINTDASINLNVGLNTTSFSLARNITKDWTVGISADRYDTKVLVSANLDNQGMMSSTARGEETFGDPNAGWLGPGKRNDLEAFVSGDLQNTSWGMKVGTALRIGKSIGLDAFLNIPPSRLVMKDKVRISYSSLDALNLEAEEGEDILDTSRLILSQLTRTKNTTYTSEHLSLNLPRSLTLGTHLRAGFFTLALNYSQYSGSLSLDYRCKEQRAITPPPSASSRDDSLATSYRAYSEGFTPKSSFRVGMDFGLFRLGGGAIIGDEVSSGFKEDDQPREPQTGIILPFFSTGLTVPLKENLKMGMVLAALPLTALRISVNYNF
ncbi:MAG: hypothetical protein J7J76_02390 [Candidatus Latescibacteria bacterium]|nr:hypothetical protein [Candidatus Latescibacterota bacterium]